MKDCSISIANALGLLQSSIKPSKCLSLVELTNDSNFWTARCPLYIRQYYIEIPVKIYNCLYQAITLICALLQYVQACQVWSILKNFGIIAFHQNCSCCSPTLSMVLIAVSLLVIKNVIKYSCVWSLLIFVLIPCGLFMCDCSTSQLFCNWYIDIIIFPLFISLTCSDRMIHICISLCAFIVFTSSGFGT